jgi:uncharacterized protein (DUF697 family)
MPLDLSKYKSEFAEFISEPSTQKLGLKVLSWIAVFLAPIKGLLLAVGFLLLVDLITGIWAAYKEGQRIESHKLRRSVTKSTSYLIAVLAGFVAQKYLMGDLIPVVNVVGGLIGATEIVSVYENLSKISGVDFASKIKELLQPPKVEKPQDSSPSKEDLESK